MSQQMWISISILSQLNPQPCEKATENMIFEQRPKGGERGSHVDIWGRLFQAGPTVSAKALGHGGGHA